VWQVAVVVVLVLAEHRDGMPLIDDQGTVEEFAADGADEAFGDRDRPWRPHRCLDEPSPADNIAAGRELLARTDSLYADVLRRLCARLDLPAATAEVPSPPDGSPICHGFSPGRGSPSRRLHWWPEDGDGRRRRSHSF
jgi:hypothetical protein